MEETFEYRSAMLSVRCLTVALNGRKILRDLDLDLKEGESLVILGCSGSGKSVLLKSILGLLPHTAESITVNGVDLERAPEEEREKARGSIGMLFQGGALFDSLTVWENVAFGLLYGRRVPPAEAKKIALEKLALVDLEPRVATLTPSALSGGMMKRVALARALALRPKIIFFDEPTTGLDPITSRLVDDLIVRSVKDSNIAAITITHDLRSLRRIADRVAFLFEGQLIWTGSLASMDQTQNPYVRQFLDALPDGPLTGR